MFLYGDDVPLNHTPTDNSGWLGRYKQGYGLAPSFLGQRFLPTS